MIISALSEGISLASVIPVLNSITEPQSILNIKIIGQFLKFFELTSNNSIIISVVSLFTICFCLASLIRILNIWLNTKFSALAGHDISIQVFKSIIFIPYEQQVQINSSEEINALITHVNNCIILFENFLQVFTSLVISSLLIVILFIINWQVALFTVIAFASAYIYISSTVRIKLLSNSKKISNLEARILQQIQEGLGSIRDIILRSNYHLLINDYSLLDHKLRITKAENNFIGSFPRYILEAIGLIIMSISIIVLSLNNVEVKLILPILGSFALGSQKLLPTLQQSYYGWVALKAYSSSSSIVINKIKSEKQKKLFLEPINYFHELRDKIELKNVSFKYSKKSPLILNNVNLTIKKGENLGIIGLSGSGKSTLLDILMGLLPPTSGEILVDGINIYNPNNLDHLRAWRNTISHVPQSIFLLNNTIEKNIAFTFSESTINNEKIISSSKKAQLHKYVMSLNDKYNSLIGERGVKISGGQRQRIAIARALYKKSSVLIFDEATSALDNFTEGKIIKSIETFSRNFTSITVSHRISTLDICDRKIKVEKGRLFDI